MVSNEKRINILSSKQTAKEPMGFSLQFYDLCTYMCVYMHVYMWKSTQSREQSVVGLNPT